MLIGTPFTTDIHFHFHSSLSAGLDATSSIELLSHLNGLAYSNRTVVLTIHQPRFEIFYMFHKLILLSDGKVAYHGVPQKAYSFFVEALMNKYLNRGLLMPQLEEHNPAGKDRRNIILLIDKCMHAT